MSLTSKQIEQRLGDIKAPFLDIDLVTAKVIHKITIKDDAATIIFQFSYPFDLVKEAFVVQVCDALPELKISIEIIYKIEARVARAGIEPIKGVKNVIAVSSAKGGVGKSTVSINLALALQQQGAKVGLLDADIYGPSQPKMLGIQKKPVSEDGKMMEPVICHGLQTMSMGYLVEEDTPMVWRGPMVTQALQQLSRQTLWQDLDYLIIDMPPGTGDIQLTMAQKLPVVGAAIVTTPQDVALLDVKKGLRMFEKVNIPVFGIIENMSVYVCSECGHVEHIFGKDGAEKIAQQYHSKILGKIPLNPSIQQQTDQGTPPVVLYPESEIAKTFQELAGSVAANLSLLTKSFAIKMPKVVVEQGENK